MNISTYKTYLDLRAILHHWHNLSEYRIITCRMLIWKLVCVTVLITVVFSYLCCGKYANISINDQWICSHYTRSWTSALFMDGEVIWVYRSAILKGLLIRTRGGGREKGFWQARKGNFPMIWGVSFIFRIKLFFSESTHNL